MEAVIATLAVLAVFIGLCVIGRFLNKRRTRGWQKIAKQLEFSFEGNLGELPEKFNVFKILSKGHSRYAYNVSRGNIGDNRIMVFDYTYNCSTKASKRKRVTLCILSSNRLELPHCSLRIEFVLDSLGKLFGGQDINFVDDADFSEAFVLQGPN